MRRMTTVDETCDDIAMSSPHQSPAKGQVVAGGRFDFDDGGTFCGGWEESKAHGHGLCTGPKGQGEYSGSWQNGFEVSGVYVWPTGGTYEGQWENGKRHGLGIETRGRWIYKGEWTTGLKGRYGVRQCITSGAKYDGTWATGLQDGYGSETYADGGTFQGQWMRGMRHGYGVRSSAPYGLAAPTKPKEVMTKSGSLTSLNGELPFEVAARKRLTEACHKGGFVLKAIRDSSRTCPTLEKTSTVEATFPMKYRSKQKTGFPPSRTLGTGSHEGSNESLSSGRGSARTTTGSFVSGEDDITDTNVIETYMGEWKLDKRSGYGIAERSDGLKYEGEWHNNRKYGYGITTFKDGTQESGKYVNNLLVTSGDKKHLFFLRSTKFRRKAEAAFNGALRASEIALQKADIAISRTATARGKAEQTISVAEQAAEDSRIARLVARQFAPEFQQSESSHTRGARTFSSLQTREDSNHSRSRSLYVPSSDHSFSKNLLQVENEGNPYFRREPSPPPAQSAFLDVFRNNPDRRPSAVNFLRRPSAIGSVRRPSTVVELKLAPRVVEQSSNPYRDYSGGNRDYIGGNQNYAGGHRDYGGGNRNYAGGNRSYTAQDAVEEHYSHYKDPPVKRRTKSPLVPVRCRPVAPIYPALLKIYTTGEETSPPGSRTSSTMDYEDGSSPSRTPRRSTLPNALDPDNVQLNFTEPEEDEEGNDSMANFPILRTTSLSHYPGRKTANATKGNTVTARKKSLPDITNIDPSGSRLISRETMSILSSQRREAIRREEEEALRLRGNPLLYLCSPNMKDWLSRQQLLILVLFINISLAILFFKLLT